MILCLVLISPQHSTPRQVGYLHLTEWYSVALHIGVIACFCLLRSQQSFQQNTIIIGSQNSETAIVSLLISPTIQEVLNMEYRSYRGGEKGREAMKEESPDARVSAQLPLLPPLALLVAE